jgi:dienelactone hydrolase
VFAEESVEAGVCVTTFTVQRTTDVFGVLWAPADQKPSAVVLLGHGGSQHRRDPGIESIARRLVRRHGLAVAAIDHLPGHGQRPPTEGAESFSNGLPWNERREQLLAAGPPVEFPERLAAAVRALPVDEIVDDWRATVDALLPRLGSLPIGYLGMSGGAAIGYCLAAADDRIAAAALGLAGTVMFPFAAAVAPRVTIPVLAFLAWDDQVIPRETAFELFGLIESKRKVLHAYPGNHYEVPKQEVDAIGSFLAAELERSEPEHT